MMFPNNKNSTPEKAPILKFNLKHASRLLEISMPPRYNKKGSSGKCVPIRSDLTAERAEETQKHTEKKEEKR